MFVFLARTLRRTFLLALLAFLSAVFSHAGALAQAHPLPSWNDGAVKKSITDFVSQTTTAGSAGFVPVEHSIATLKGRGGCRISGAQSHSRSDKS
jgi:hypothetical protein